MKFFENLNIYFSVRQTIPWMIFAIIVSIFAYVYTRDIVLFIMFLILVLMTLLMFFINWTYLLKQNHEKLKAKIQMARPKKIMYKRGRRK